MRACRPQAGAKRFHLCSSEINRNSAFCRLQKIFKQMNQMKYFNFLIVTLMFLSLSCSKDDNPIEETPPIEETQGYNMLLIGNSFFKPYAENLDALAMDAGFENHHSTLVKRGGENGRPINFWNDSTSQEHQLIKAVLDQGDIELFGMTSGHEAENPTEGHRAWIEYALHKNPDITIFIATPCIDFPANWNQLVADNGFDSVQELYEYFIDEIVHHNIVDELRAEFPSTNIFTIPTGWAAINLNQMHQDSLLLDDIDFMGPKPSSLFTDHKGHQGQIVIETGTLVWLNSIYDVDLSENNYETGFNTNLHDIAQQIMDHHDSNYKQ